MGATEEQMQLLSDAGVDHISYLLMLYSIAFLLYLCKSHRLESACYLANLNTVVNMLLYLYAVNSEPASIKLDPEHGHQNGHLTNGHVHPTHERVRDAEEFELEGLTSEDEDAADSEPLVKKEERRGE